MRCVRVTIVAVEKRLSITYFEYVSAASVIQRANRMRSVVQPSLACRLYRIFPHYPINGTTFQGEKKVM